jgi:hypothetical protein
MNVESFPSSLNHSSFLVHRFFILHPLSFILSMSDSSLDRSLGRVEARVADLTTQISSLREEVSGIAHSVETAVAAHRERIAALESFRRWMIGLMTGLFMSAVAAVLGYVFRA